MKLTEEQQQIINHRGNARVNAVAGSGKTTTLLNLVKARDDKPKTLYVAFNKSVKLEAEQKFQSAGLSHVDVLTAHSLAFRKVVAHNRYQVRNSYSNHEIKELLGLNAGTEKHHPYLLANHIGKYVAYFCNSSARKVQQLNYLDVVSGDQSRQFVANFYEVIQTGARKMLAMMDKGSIEVTHDFYLKKFQLSNPKLPYELILFDEAQDASPAMLDVIRRQQKAEKMLVGDAHQQIYGWRHAVNSLQQLDYPTLRLTTSFRFNQSVAALASQVLDYKSLITEKHQPVPIFGAGPGTSPYEEGVLARTNLELLKKAIERVESAGDGLSIYFEGNINSYTYAEDGTSIYDVLSLFNDRRESIRDPMIKSLSSFEQLEEYVEDSEDVQLGAIVEMVKLYQNDLPGMIKRLKELHAEDEDKAGADVIFSTVHRAKGMEYNTVELADDFITTEKIEKLLEGDENADHLTQQRITEEVNLLYVAATRACERLRIPESIMPESSVEVIEPAANTDASNQEEPRYSWGKYSRKSSAETSSADSTDGGFSKGGRTVEPMLKTYYKKWTRREEQQLVNELEDGKSISEIAENHDRTTGAIRTRIKKLGI